MIIVRSPLRLSYFGGGTDLPKYYQQDYGCVLGQAIDKYVYVILNKRFEKNIRLSYMKNELVESVAKIKHGLIKESFKEFGIKNEIELVTIGDIPGTGTGLGSSSSLSVSLSHSLSLFLKKPIKKSEIAQKACKLEIEKLKSPIGKQDQYLSTYGGLLFIKFEKDNNVNVEKLALKNSLRNELEQNILGFYTGITRKTNTILQKQNERTKLNLKSLDKMRSLAEEGRDYLRNNDLSNFSLLFNKSWEIKKSLSTGITNPVIDSIYKKGISAGAVGGKISGAGGGGFVFFYCEPRYQKELRRSLKNFKELTFGFDTMGTMQLN
jgi:D-glycero-alpha-D-manno-heptose-7-phosphate kinase